MNITALRPLPLAGLLTSPFPFLFSLYMYFIFYPNILLYPEDGGKRMLRNVETFSSRAKDISVYNTTIFRRLYSLRRFYFSPSSIPGRARFLSSPQRPDRLWGPPSFLSDGYQGLFPRG
jgi:hypothetical protein